MLRFLVTRPRPTDACFAFRPTCIQMEAAYRDAGYQRQEATVYADNAQDFKRNRIA